MKYFTSLAALAAVSALASSAFAQGLFVGTQGARAAGRAGAFTARADDLSAVELNPAGLAGIGKLVIHVGNRFSHNTYDFTRQSTQDWGNLESNGNAPTVTFGTVRNAKPLQMLDPMIGVATNFGLKDWGFALAAYAPAGISHAQYPVWGGQRYMMVETQTQMLNYTASVAWKFRDLFGIGASLQWIAVPNLQYQLVVNGEPTTRSSREYPVTSPLDMVSTVKGSDLFTPNAIIGVWLRPLEYLQFGTSAQVIPATINASGHLSVVPAFPSESVKSVELKRNNRPADDVTISIPLPLKLRQGIRYRHIREGQEIFDLELDVAYEFWSRVQQFTVESNNLIGRLGTNTVPIGRIDIKKQWKNSLSVMLGGDYAVLPKALTVRGGTFYTTAVADPAYTQIDFMTGRQLGGTLGLSVFAGALEVAAAYEYRHQLPITITEADGRVYQQAPGSPCKAPYTTADGCNSHYVGVPAPVVNAGVYKAHIHAAALDLLYRF